LFVIQVAEVNEHPMTSLGSVETSGQKFAGSKVHHHPLIASLFVKDLNF